MQNIAQLLRVLGGPLRVVFDSLAEFRMGQFALLAMLLGMWAWYQFGSQSQPPVIPPTILESVKALSSEVPPALPRPRRALRPTLVLPLVDDRELLVTQGIRQALEQQGWYRPVEKGPLVQFCDGLFSTIGMPRETVASPAIAIKLARATSAEVVLLGKLEQLELIRGHADVGFSLRTFEVQSGNVLYEGRFQSPRPGIFHGIITGWGLAVAGVIGLALLLPPVTIPVMRRVLRMESNKATAFTILLVTAVPAVLAWPVVFGSSVETWRIIGFAGAVLLAGLWCIAVMTWVAERQT